MIVFCVSGLWHGASLSFVMWGGMNGAYQVVGEIMQPVRSKLVHLLRLNKESLAHRFLRTISTFILIDFSWIFFRANGFKESLRIIKSIFVKNPWILFDGSLYSCGLDYKNFHLMLISILILVFADYCKTRGIRIRDVIIKQDYWFRWLFISISIVVILTFGIWGPNYNEANFIYFQF